MADLLAKYRAIVSERDQEIADLCAALEEEQQKRIAAESLLRQLGVSR